MMTDESLGAGDASLGGDGGAELRELMDSMLEAGDTDLRRFLDEDARFLSVAYDLYGGLPLGLGFCCVDGAVAACLTGDCGCRRFGINGI